MHWSREDRAEEERRLVARYQSGDSAAYGELYAMCLEPVNAFVKSLIPWDPHTAEDITQDAFVRGMGNVMRWKWEGKSIMSLFFTIARRLVLDLVKSSRYKREVPNRMRNSMDNSDFYRDEIDTSREGNPEDTVIAHLESIKMLEAMQNLPDEQFDVLYYRFIKDMSLLDTMTVMGKKLSATKSMQNRATTSLARYYLQKGEPDAQDGPYTHARHAPGAA